MPTEIAKQSKQMSREEEAKINQNRLGAVRQPSPERPKTPETKTDMKLRVSREYRLEMQKNLLSFLIQQ